jgi:hypothetical protein
MRIMAPIAEGTGAAIRIHAFFFRLSSRPLCSFIACQNHDSLCLSGLVGAPTGCAVHRTPVFAAVCTDHHLGRSLEPPILQFVGFRTQNAFCGAFSDSRGPPRALLSVSRPRDGRSMEAASWTARRTGPTEQQQYFGPWTCQHPMAPISPPLRAPHLHTPSTTPSPIHPLIIHPLIVHRFIIHPLALTPSITTPPDSIVSLERASTPSYRPLSTSICLSPSSRPQLDPSTPAIAALRSTVV